jgi:hypothetical protein
MLKINLSPFIPKTKSTVDLSFKKVVWTYLPLVLMVVGLGMFLNQVRTPQRLFTQASGGATLSFALSKREVRVGEEFTTEVYLDPHDSSPKYVYLALGFSPEELEVIDGGPTYAKITLDGQPEVKVLGTVRFKALKVSDKVSINYSSETWVSDINNENILNRTIGTQIKITP